MFEAYDELMGSSKASKQLGNDEGHVLVDLGMGKTDRHSTQVHNLN